MKKATLLAPSLVLALAGTGCGAPAAPFNQMPQSQVTVYRLQNFPPIATAAPAAGGLPLPFPIPQEITSWIGSGANGLPIQAFCGLGLPLPGCTPGTTPGVSQPAPDAPRFHNFRILGQSPISNESDKEELAKILGREGNFETPSNSCMYPEYGISFGVPQNDLLISLSCHRVEAKYFQWPFSVNGIKSNTQEKLANIFKRLPLY
ncbi:MAG: hypothetical protein RMJ98_04320 [Myxococcales bacterium]|nr:hypothetical protein [Polyangiaceae bacterium]MDW8248516.1 hypothetical protein [Myxococcales bacterium]